jgi:hypothetical protein
LGREAGAATKKKVAMPVKSMHNQFHTGSILLSALNVTQLYIYELMKAEPEFDRTEVGMQA